MRYLTLSVLVLASCTSPSPNDTLQEYIHACGKGTSFAKVGTQLISEEAVRLEYQAYITTRFPQAEWDKHLSDAAAQHAYGEWIAKEYLLAMAAMQSDIVDKRAYLIMLNAALRSAAADLYLRYTVDYQRLVSSQAYANLSDKQVDDFYSKNKAEYDKQGIPEKTARATLLMKLYQRKKELADAYINLEREGLINELMKKTTFDVRKTD